MSDHDIIAQLVKVRERFRQLMQIYQQARAAGGDVGLLTNAEQILAAAMEQMRQLPEKPGQSCGTEENRDYAGQLLREIGDLLQLTLVMDREARRIPITRPVTPAVELAPAGAARDRAMRSYAR